MKHLVKIVQKEFNAYFASPAAWLFMGAFLVVTLFAFFWGEAFFARNIADMKPFFNWIPILLIFLVGALSMRTWSEERRSGTIESLLTSPVGAFQIVMGKFFANVALVALALVLTLPLAISVSLMGPLDWGPVIGGYVASLFLAAAYVAIGLYMSGRTDNPIVALILTVACTGAFYLIGSNMLTSLFGYKVGGILELIGSGSRFDSITRGVLDIRDLYYYLSVVCTFIALNTLSLERLRWAGNPSRRHHRQWVLFTLLLVANLLVANFWLNGIRTARIDLTEGKIYSLSSATKDYISQAVEPLLIRGYFSQKSHPLLEPLVPQLKDLLEEYQVIGGSRLRVEFVDPHSDQDIEAEAADKYGIRPVPFRIASRYEAGVVNSYFDIVIAYGDEYEVLSFDDLIEVKASNLSEPEVLLKNPEYAITSALRKVIGSYRAGGNLYTDLPGSVSLKAYVSTAEKLPQALADFRGTMETTLQEMAKESNGKLSYELADPAAAGGELGKQINQKYGFVPQVASLFDTDPFWFYMVLEGSSESVQIGLPEELSRSGLKKNIEAALKRMTPGYLKTVAIVTPPQKQPQNPYMPPQPGKSFDILRSVLEENVRVIDADLSNGVAPADAEMLLILAPENFSEKEIFAVDQFLMRGGSVAMTTSGFDVSITNTLNATTGHSGLEDWLASLGFDVQDSMVLDPQNASLPVPMPRRVGPVSVNEIVMMPYPHFPDIRRDGLNAEHPITAGLSQLTINWASPIEIDLDKQYGRELTELIMSSADSWTSADTNIMPDYQAYPQTGFAPGLARTRYTLAISSKGRFDSYFKDKQSPLLSEKTVSEENEGGTSEAEEKSTVYGSVIQNSSDSARLILVGSNSFAEDRALSISSQGAGMEYTAPLEFMQNLIDWSLDDTGLLSIRSRSQLARTLEPMKDSKRRVFEYGNYAAAVAGLMIVWMIRQILRKRKFARYDKILAEI
jgi:ABC-2 type transport system permease protein